MRQVSACSAARSWARWWASDPPGSTIRRAATTVAASLLLVVASGVPAWAGSSLTPTKVEADIDRDLVLTVTEPEDEAYGDTARVAVTAPSGFTVLACGSTPVGWSCTVAEGGTGATFTRTSPVSLAASNDFGFRVHTPAVNGQYAFRVAQADGPASEEDPPATVSSAPAVTVTGGQDPPPADGGTGGSGGGDTGETGGDTDGDGTDGTDDGTDGIDDGGTTTGDDTDPADDRAAATDGDGTSGGSTAPRRTQGRASGTTLQITPGEPHPGDDPAVAPPDVAEDSAAARSDDTREQTTVVAGDEAASGQPREGAPWQQWVGAALLLAGGALLGVRRLRERRAAG